MIVDLLEWLNAGSLLPGPRVVEPYLREDLDLPAIVYEIQSEEVERDLLTKVGTLRLSTVSFRCLSNTFSVAESTAAAVMREAMATGPTDSVLLLPKSAYTPSGRMLA